MTELLSSHVPDADALAHHVPAPLGALSLDQVQARHKLVRLHRTLDPERSDYDFPFVEELSAISPEQAAARLATERAIANNPNIVQYDTYVNDLRTIRSEQRDYLQSSLAALPETATQQEKRAAYLDALDHSPALVRRSMVHINEHTAALELAKPKVHDVGPPGFFLDLSDDSPRDSPVFTEEQIASASQNPYMFRQALMQLTMRRPEAVLSAPDVLATVADRQDIVYALHSLTATHPVELVHSLANIKDLLEPHELKQVVKDTLRRNNGAFIADVVHNQAARDTMSPDELADTIQNVMEQAHRLPDAKTLELCVRNQWVDRSTIAVKAAQLLEASPINEIGSELDNETLFTPDERRQIRQMLVEQYRSGPTERLMSVSHCHALPIEQREALVMERYATDPVTTVSNFEPVVAKHVPADQLRQTILDALAQDLDEGKLADKALTSAVLSLDDKRAYAMQLLQANPRTFMEEQKYMRGLMGYPELFPADQLDALTAQAIRAAPFASVAFSMGEGLLKHLGDTSAQREFIDQKLKTEPTLEVFLPHNTPVLQELYTHDEQIERFQATVDQLLAAGTPIEANEVHQLLGMYGDVGRDFADKILTLRPEALAEALHYSDTARLFSPDVIRRYITEISKSDAGASALLSQLVGPHPLIEYLEPHDLENMLLRQSPLKGHLIVGRAGKFSAYLTEAQLAGILHHISQDNPATILVAPEQYEHYLPGFDANKFLDRALQDPHYMPLAGQYLRTAIERLRAEGTAPAEHDRILADLVTMYQALALHKQADRLSDLRPLHDALRPDAQGEYQLINLYDVVARLGSDQERAQVRQCTSLEQLDILATQVTAHALGIEETIRAEQSQQFRQTMGSAMPIGLYAIQYKDSLRHAEVLRPLYRSLLDGTYHTWKYGPDTPDNLAALQRNQLLPAQLTSEQYRSWQTESVTSVRETFTVEAAGVADRIRHVLHDNAAVLPPGAFDGADQRDHTLAMLSQELSEVGSTIGSIHAELKQLRDLQDAVMAEAHIRLVKDELQDLTERRRVLQIKQDVLRLLTLTGQEVVSNTFTATNQSSKGKPIAQALNTLRKGLGPDAAFVSEQLAALLDGYHTQQGKPETLTVVDTDDPKRTIEIGDRPIASCQNYRNGVENIALLGYTEANTKILFTTNEKGRPVARAIIRLLGDRAGRPHLHVETIYSTSASDGIARAAYRHAIAKAGAMGVPVLMSEQSQNAAGAMVAAHQVSGMSYEPAATTLVSYAARAPYVYVDSKGGKQEWGDYVLKDLARPTPTSSI